MIDIRGTGSDLPVRSSGKAPARWSHPHRPPLKQPAGGRAGAGRIWSEGLASGERRELLTRLMRDHGDEILRFCVSMLHDQAAAEDVRQTIFVDAWQALDRYSGAGQPARLVVRDRPPPLPGRGQDGPAAALAVLAGAGRRRRSGGRGRRSRPGPGPAASRGRPARLPAPSARRESGCSVLLRYEEGLPYEEIARMSRERPPTVQARVARALPHAAGVRGRQRGAAVTRPVARPAATASMTGSCCARSGASRARFIRVLRFTSGHLPRPASSGWPAPRHCAGPSGQLPCATSRPPTGSRRSGPASTSAAGSAAAPAVVAGPAGGAGRGQRVVARAIAAADPGRGGRSRAGAGVRGGPRTDAQRRRGGGGDRGPRRRRHCRWRMPNCGSTGTTLACSSAARPSHRASAATGRLAARFTIPAIGRYRVLLLQAPVPLPAARGWLRSGPGSRYRGAIDRTRRQSFEVW